MSGYESTCDVLTHRILGLIPENPDILEMYDCWKLFDVEGFKCDDLQPSMAQAGFALRAAQQMYRAGDKQQVAAIVAPGQ
jgi:hypothetical protein